MPLEPRFLTLAERFVQLVHEWTGFPVIVCDELGVIRRASVRSRIGDTHPAAQRLMRGEAAEIAITAAQEAANPLTKEGLNCPIVLEGRRVGTFGLAGPLEVTTPLARVSATMLASWLKELRQNAILHDTAHGVFKVVDSLTARVGESTASALRTSEHMSSSSARAAEEVRSAAEAIASIRRIAKQSRILSINGSVEATRAGDRGRTFAVVAKDMTRLAEETAFASEAIDGTLANIGAAIGRVQAAVLRSSGAATSQAEAFGRISAALARLKEVLSGLQRASGERSIG